MSGKMFVFGMAPVAKDNPQPEVKPETIQEKPEVKPEVKPIAPPANAKLKYFAIPLRGEPIQATREQIITQLLDGEIHRAEVRGTSKTAQVDHIYCDSMPPFHVFDERKWEKGAYRSSEDAVEMAEKSAL